MIVKLILIFLASSLMSAYITHDNKTLIIFNGINHIRLISISYDCKVTAIYKELISLLDFIKREIIINFDDIYGYLTNKPLNSGCAFEMRLRYEDADIENLKIEANKNDLTTEKIPQNGLEIFNRNKINLSQTDIIKKFIKFLNI